VSVQGQARGRAPVFTVSILSCVSSIRPRFAASGCGWPPKTTT